jgi:hypothetical protein
MASSAAFAALRDALDSRYRSASAGAFEQAGGSMLETGLLRFPKGAISTLEGAASSGRSALAARVLADATADGGAGALVEWHADPNGFYFPPSLESAGVALERLVIVRACEPLDVVRAADILLRSGAFNVIVIPAVASRAAAWSRLANLAHRAGAVLLAVGTQACEELRYFASLRVECALETIDWAGAPGPFRKLCGYDVCTQICKHKRAIPTGRGRVKVG